MTDKPLDITAYLGWLKEELDVSVDKASGTYYQAATRALVDHLKRSTFWRAFIRQLAEFDEEYRARRPTYLLMERVEPEVFVKPFKSVVDKSFRKNVVENENWPNPPGGGWILPDTWLTTIRDIVRASIAAKYLDGVTFVADKVRELAEEHGHEAVIDYEAREEGYYAAHVYVDLPAEIPLPKWDTREIVFSLELQVTTQMQEAIRTLTHPHYVSRRSRPRDESAKKWQWNYDSDEFRANYLAHTLHHLEGLIMDLREARGGERDE